MKETTDDALVLRDLVPVEPLLPDASVPIWVWLLLALGLCLLGLLAFILLKRKKAAPVDPRKIREEAYRQAVNELEPVAAMASTQDAATTVSIALRRYLATVSGDPALFETHEEFVARHQSLASYPEDLRQSTAEGFSHLARLKYGREAKGDSAALSTAARQLLDRLHQHQPA